MELKEMIELAIEAKEKQSYTPYSNFKVGACIEMEDGSVYSGGNIEISSFLILIFKNIFYLKMSTGMATPF